MNYEVRAAPRFEQRLKRLAKKYRRVGQDAAPLINLLAANPRAGDSIPGFGDTVFKIRLASSDMKKGKSGGFRVIYYLNEAARLVWLLTIYAKSEQENPDPAELQDLLAELGVPTAEPQEGTEERNTPNAHQLPRHDSIGLSRRRPARRRLTAAPGVLVSRQQDTRHAA